MRRPSVPQIFLLPIPALVFLLACGGEMREAGTSEVQQPESAVSVADRDLDRLAGSFRV